MGYLELYLFSINSVNPEFFNHPTAKEVFYTLNGHSRRYECRSFGLIPFARFSLEEAMPLLGVYNQ